MAGERTYLPSQPQSLVGTPQGGGGKEERQEIWGTLLSLRFFQFGLCLAFLCEGCRAPPMSPCFLRRSASPSPFPSFSLVTCLGPSQGARCHIPGAGGPPLYCH